MSFTDIRTHSFRDKMFRIIWRRPKRSADEIPGKNFGKCEHPAQPFEHRAMHIYPKQDASELMWTILHESQHACFPDLDDPAIDEWEADTKRLLRRMKCKVTFD